MQDEEEEPIKVKAEEKKEGGIEEKERAEESSDT